VRRLIKELRSLYPAMTVSDLYAELANRCPANSALPSVSSVLRYLKTLPKPSSTEPQQAMERRRFVMEHANDCWQADTCSGPFLNFDGRKRRAYLIAFIDDASRIIPHAEFFFFDNALNLAITLKKAILKRGIPKKIFVDNGKSYASLSLRFACARLGIMLSHARPYSPASKGKVERFFGVLRTQFLNNVRPEEVRDLGHLNDMLNSYIEGVYHVHSHSGLDGQSPIQRYMADKGYIRPIRSKEELDTAFLYETTRRVNSDATIAISKVVFEVPQSFIGSQVKVGYDPTDLSKAHIMDSDFKISTTVYPVRPTDNARIPRAQYQNQRISYSLLFPEVDLDV
jgi:putative transposase